MNEMIGQYLSSHPSLAFILLLFIFIILHIFMFISGVYLIRKVKDEKIKTNTIRDIFIGIISGAIAAYLVSVKDLISLSEIFTWGFWINLLSAICVLIFCIGAATWIIGFITRKR